MLATNSAIGQASLRATPPKRLIHHVPGRECAQHRGKVYGLVAPLFEQAKVCANHLALKAFASYKGSKTSTKLKVTGIDLFSAGEFKGNDNTEDIIFKDPHSGVYKKLVLDGDRLAGAVLYGDTVDGSWYFQLMREGSDISELRRTMMFGQSHVGDSGTGGIDVSARQFDIAQLAGLDDADYDALEPVQWPVRRNGKIEGTARLYSDGRFSTPDRRARFVPVKPQLARSQPSSKYPFVLNTGRVRDHWHSMTRSGVSPKLSAHRAEPYVEIHPDDAATQGLIDGGLATVTSPIGEAVLRVDVSKHQQKGSLFVPMHWSGIYSGKARVGALVAAQCDPISGQPESKGSVARIRPFASRWQGFILSRRQLATQALSYWTRARDKGLWRYEIAGDSSISEWGDKAHRLLATAGSDNWIDYHDSGAGLYRAARFLGGRLDGCVFIAPDRQPTSRQWLAGLFHEDALSAEERAAILSGQPPADVEDQGAIVCSCFNVGEKTIRKAFADGCATTTEIGQCLKAGTNCGSCLPEIQDLLRVAQENRG